MMWHKSAKSILLAMTFAGFWMSGCGGSGSANQVIVTVTGTASIMLPTQTQTITASVTGATDVTSTFDCSYTTTPNPTTSVPNPKPSASASCASATVKDPTDPNGAMIPAVGTLTPIASTSTTVPSTATFTAPKFFPDQTKLPNVTVTITATSNADKRKTGKFNIFFDSGIRITLTPATATLGTLDTQQFFAKDFNGNVIPPDQLTWGVTFEVTAKISSASCSGGTNDCGSIATNASNVEVYTALLPLPRPPRPSTQQGSSPSPLTPKWITRALPRPPSPLSKPVILLSAAFLQPSRLKAACSRTSSLPPPTPLLNSASPWTLQTRTAPKLLFRTITSRLILRRSKSFSPRVRLLPRSELACD